jgi:hypothetical protein
VIPLMFATLSGVVAAHQAHPRVANWRGKVWVDDYAVPMTTMGEHMLLAALEDDRHWLAGRAFISNGVGEGGFVYERIPTP